MAYAAVISLKQTIHRLLHSSRTPIVSSSPEILEFAYKQATSSQEFLEEFYDSSSNSWNALDFKIKNAAQKLEDALDFQVSNQFLSLPETQIPVKLDFEEARQHINSFVEDMKQMKDEYTKELNHPSGVNYDEYDAAVSSHIDSGVEMIGLSGELAEIKGHLLRPIRPCDFGVFSFVGVIGSLRTITAKTLFDEVFVGKEQPFDCGAWVTIGRIYRLTEILTTILDQVDDDCALLNSDGDVEKLGEALLSSLKGRRYMIVVDDIDRTEVWGWLKKYFPEQDNGSLVILTTALIEVAQFANSFYIHEMPVVITSCLAWDYIRIVFFGVNGLIPSELEKAGKKIAENCGTSMIALVRVVLHLSKAQKTLECWSKLAAEEQNSIFLVEDEISEVCKIKEDMQTVDETFRSTVDLLDMSHAAKKIKDYLFPKTYFPNMEIMFFYGMAGIGKTTFIKSIFEDSSISHRFDHCVWITLGPKYKPEQLLVDILAQLYPDIDRKDVQVMELSHKRCFIVLDDLWNLEPLRHLKSSLPNIRGEIFVTTRQLVGLLSLGPDDRYYTVRLLDEEESWDLFRQKVFPEESCPPGLENPGKKISKNCEGLPLLIIKVADLLLKAEKTLAYWNMVAEQPNSVFIEAYDQISKVLYPSYKYLPQHLKPCFLYMGVFPQGYKVRTSKLIYLWVAEGFLEPNPSQTVEDFAAKCLSEIVDRSLVMVQKKDGYPKTSKNWDLDPNTSKTCSLHSVFWHLCCSEAKKSKFFHELKTYNSAQDLMDQRIVCVRNNVLLGIKDVHSSMSLASNSRSFLCTSPYHQYPVPLSHKSRLLRVLEAPSIRLYEFPVEVVDLIHLRYLALTCDGSLPTSISKLHNLETLILRRHLNIKSSEASSFLPVEIWVLKQLKYLRVTGCNLPRPSRGEVLTNLLELLDVRIDSCIEEVLRAVTNLRRLGVQIVLDPDDDGRHWYYLNHITYLSKLESLKCVVLNPELRHDIVAPPPMFPPGLKKLSLSGLGYPWTYMSIISRLENLEVLKLRCYAFAGAMWETEYNSFPQLKFLSFEETDFVVWRAKHPSFFSAKHIRIRHCYNLEELPHYLPLSVETLQVVDCSPSAVSWAEQTGQMDLERKLDKLVVRVHSSWGDDDRNVKL